jgi:hypothetical protein
MPNPGQRRLDLVALGGFVLILIACAAVAIPTAIHRAHAGTAHSTSKPLQPPAGRVPPRGVLHPVPQELPLGRANLYGYWRASGVVVAGDGKIYSVGARLLSREWYFARPCRHGRCARRMTRSSTSGLLTTTFHGRAPRWTASFAHYGLLTCGPAAKRVPAHLSSRWRFTLTPNMTHLEAIERLTAPPICGASPVTIRWEAKPGRPPDSAPARHSDA